MKDQVNQTNRKLKTKNKMKTKKAHDDFYAATDAKLIEADAALTATTAAYNTAYNAADATRALAAYNAARTHATALAAAYADACAAATVAYAAYTDNLKTEITNENTNYRTTPAGDCRPA